MNTSSNDLAKATCCPLNNKANVMSILIKANFKNIMIKKNRLQLLVLPVALQYPHIRA